MMNPVRTLWQCFASPARHAAQLAVRGGPPAHHHRLRLHGSTLTVSPCTLLKRPAHRTTSCVLCCVVLRYVYPHIGRLRHSLAMLDAVRPRHKVIVSHATNQ